MKAYLLFFFLLINLSVFSQNPSPNVISTAGGSGGNAGSSVSWTIGEGVIQSFWYSSGVLTQGFQQPFAPYRLSGQLQYTNLLHSPVDSARVYLYNLGGIKVDSANVNGSGHFYFYQAPGGNLTTAGKTSRKWGGVNATDALLILKHYVNISVLQGLNRKAADVNNSGSINSTDALLVAKRFTLAINSFAAGDWLFAKDTLSLSTNMSNHDIRTICVGDVNGSYNPPLKLSPRVSLVQQGQITTGKGELLVLPIISLEKVETNAISLVLNIPAAICKIESVETPIPGGNLVWNQTEDQLRLCWYSLQPMNLEVNQTIFNLSCRIKEAGQLSSVVLSPDLDEESEMADPEAFTIPHVNLGMPMIVREDPAPGLLLSACYPNPFSESTTFSYLLSEESIVGLNLFDPLGRLVWENDLGSQPAGDHTCQIEAGNHSPGTYLLVFSARAGEKISQQRQRIIISK